MADRGRRASRPTRSLNSGQLHFVYGLELKCLQMDWAQGRRPLMGVPRY